MALATTVTSLVADAALGIWLGSMVFFSFLGAPRVFRVLDDAAAARVVNAIFPRYYVFGTALGVVAVAAGLVGGALSGFDPATWALVLAAAVGVVASAYARWVLVPKMDAAGEGAFERYHSLSVTLNGVAMLAVAAALVASHL